MGGGMARALLEGSCSRTVTGYDRAPNLVDAFFAESTVVAHNNNNKALLSQPPQCLRQAVTPATNVCILVLLNEAQCEQVCFGNGSSKQQDDDENLLSLLSPDTFVLLCSTVTPAWAIHAMQRFQKKSIHLIDCPTSGGPVRARQGDLTLMVSYEQQFTSVTNDNDADDDSALVVLFQQRVEPVLQCLGRSADIHRIAGGVGRASTAKMVHQLLAGVHIVVAAEALALAAAADLDVQQLYRIVNGAAGASWMFRDRGERMMAMRGGDSNANHNHNNNNHAPPPPEAATVKSMLDIFVKDLDIVYAEAKRLKVPTPLASAALQQFISGQGLGLGRQDDSQVVQVYENVTGKRVCGGGALTSDTSTKKEGTNVGDFWKMQDGTMEEILEVGQEPRHQIVLQNDYVRALRVAFPPNDTTLAHRHAQDSLYFFLVEDLQVVNHMQGLDPCCDCMELGEVRYGTHRTDQPLVHKISNRTNTAVLCIDAEILQTPPVTSPLPLVAEHHELIKTRDRCRVYKLTLEPGEAVTVSYPFFHCTVVLHGNTSIEKVMGGRLRWTETFRRGDVAWKEPVMELTKSNAGPTTFVEFIAEWR